MTPYGPEGRRHHRLAADRVRGPHEDLAPAAFEGDPVIVDAGAAGSLELDVATDLESVVELGAPVEDHLHVMHHEHAGIGVDAVLVGEVGVHVVEAAQLEVRLHLVGHGGARRDRHGGGQGAGAQKPMLVRFHAWSSKCVTLRPRSLSMSHSARSTRMATEPARRKQKTAKCVFSDTLLPASPGGEPRAGLYPCAGPVRPEGPRIRVARSGRPLQTAAVPAEGREREAPKTMSAQGTRGFR